VTTALQLLSQNTFAVSVNDPDAIKAGKERLIQEFVDTVEGFVALNPMTFNSETASSPLSSTAIRLGSGALRFCRELFFQGLHGRHDIEAVQPSPHRSRRVWIPRSLTINRPDPYPVAFQYFHGCVGCTRLSGCRSGPWRNFADLRRSSAAWFSELFGAARLPRDLDVPHGAIASALNSETTCARAASNSVWRSSSLFENSASSLECFSASAARSTFRDALKPSCESKASFSVFRYSGLQPDWVR